MKALDAKSLNMKAEDLKEVLAKLKSSQFVAQKPVWVDPEPLITIPEGSYDVEEKQLDGFTLNVASFKIGKDTFEFAYRSKVVPDQDGDLVIAEFTANSDFTCTNGKVIKKGTTKQFATNA